MKNKLSYRGLGLFADVFASELRLVAQWLWNYFYNHDIVKSKGFKFTHVSWDNRAASDKSSADLFQLPDIIRRYVGLNVHRSIINYSYVRILWQKWDACSPSRMPSDLGCSQQVQACPLLLSQVGVFKPASRTACLFTWLLFLCF